MTCAPSRSQLSATRPSHVIQVAIERCRMQKSFCLSTLTQFSGPLHKLFLQSEILMPSLCLCRRLFYQEPASLRQWENPEEELERWFTG